MAKTTNKKTNKRPAPKSRPLSTAKSVSPDAPKKPVRKTTTKKPATKSVSKKKPAAQSKTTTKKAASAKPRKSAVKAKTSRQLNLPLGRSIKLVVTLKRTKPKKSKKSEAASKKTKLVGRLKRRRARRLQLLLSGAMVTAGLLGSVYFGLQVAAAPPAAPKLITPPAAAPVIPASPVEKSLPRSEPMRLRVPNIQIDTSVIAVGLDKTGAITVPNRYDITGWYTGGPTPGEIGPAIIVGHLDNIKGPAVFWNLYKLIPGQTIEVDRADGQKATFIIETVKEYPQGALPIEEVYGNTEYAALRLITCGGTFNKFSQRYSNNTVVFARLTD